MKSINDVIRSISGPTVLIAGMAFLVGMLTVFPTFSASFDCAKARTKSEKIVCADPAISHLDEELSRMYVQAKETSADKQAITQEQRLWINSERDKCSDAPCMIQAYKTRMMQLDKTLPKNRDEAGGSNDPSTENTKSVASDAFQPSKAKAGVQPDPVKWAEIERSLKKRQKDFITHLDSAKKLELSKVREPFPWQVDWPAVEKWCESITKAIEKKHFKFPEPAAAVTRDGSAETKNRLLTYYPECMSANIGPWEPLDDKTPWDTKRQIEEAIQLQPKSPMFHIKAELLGESSIDVKIDESGRYWYKYPGATRGSYPADSLGLFMNNNMESFSKDRNNIIYTFPDNYIVFDVQHDGISTRYGDSCPTQEGVELTGSIGSSWLTEEGLAKNFSVPGPSAIVLEVDGKPIVALYGTYNESGLYGDIWEAENRCGFCNPRYAGFGYALSNRWDSIPGYPKSPPVRWGRPGQGFILINGADDKNIWYSPWTRKPSREVLNIIDGRYPENPGTSGYVVNWQTGFLYSCIVNFDYK